VLLLSLALPSAACLAAGKYAWLNSQHSQHGLYSHSQQQALTVGDAAGLDGHLAGLVPLGHVQQTSLGQQLRGTQREAVSMWRCMEDWIAAQDAASELLQDMVRRLARSSRLLHSCQTLLLL
jgi:hypothetical protein